MTKLSPFTWADQPVALYSQENILKLTNKLTKSATLFSLENILSFITTQLFFKFNVMYAFIKNKVNPFLVDS